MPRHSPYALYSLNFITLFSINCFSLSIAWVSFDNFYLGLLLLSIREKVLPFALSLSFPPCSFRCLANCSYPRFLERPFYILKNSFSQLSVRFTLFALFGFQWTFAFDKTLFALGMKAGIQLQVYNLVRAFYRSSACAGGGLKWTRTIDLALIRRAL